MIICDTKGHEKKEALGGISVRGEESVGPADGPKETIRVEIRLHGMGSHKCPECWKATARQIDFANLIESAHMNKGAPAPVMR